MFKVLSGEVKTRQASPEELKMYREMIEKCKNKRKDLIRYDRNAGLT